MNMPFYANPDDSHCFQASLKMILETFYPDRRLSFAELDEITHKKENLYTWQLAGLNWMQKNGFKVLTIEDFDLEEFVKRPEDYLYEVYGPEVAKDQIENSDILSEVNTAKELIGSLSEERRIPTYDDICLLLKSGYLIIVNVNSNILWDAPGYGGHFIVVKDFDSDHLIVNDSGMIDGENRRIKRSLFEKAWYYPDAKAGNLYAFIKNI